VAFAKRIALPARVTRHAYAATTFVIGSLAAFWFVERVAGFFA
jgi:hypothetical protein